MRFASPSLNVACRRARAWISRSLDDDLDEPSRLRLHDHIASCAECRRHQDVLTQGRHVLRSAEVEPPENFEWKVQLGIQRALRERAAAELEPKGGGTFWRPALTSAAAVALLVVGAGWWFLPASNAPVPGGASSAEAPLWATAPASSVPTPDLSGAVPGAPIEVDATGSGFGIRTVGSFDERFRGDIYSPMRGAESVERLTVPVQELFRGTAESSTPGLRRVPPGHWWPAGHPSRGVHILNLEIHRSKMPATTGEADSAAARERR